MKKYAILSVADKTGIIEFAKELRSLQYSILATGKTAKLLVENSVECSEISSFTAFPEILEGRVKTLHPKIFGSILFRRDVEDDVKQAAQNGFESIDIVCVNLYPFKQVADKSGVTEEELIENIDIGGPSLIRAAAKNFKFVSVISNPNQYSSLVEELKLGLVSELTRKKLAVEAFSHTSEYDTFIANTLKKRFDIPCGNFRINLPEVKALRYGENPHQSASVFGDFYSYFEFIHGKELSYNNILDLVAAVGIIEEFTDTTCAIIKHNNPCGVAVDSSPLCAYEKALAADPVSAFGGIVVFNSELDEAAASKLNEIFTELIVAPSFTQKALDILFKKKDRRIIRQQKSIKNINSEFRSIPGGVLTQSPDNKVLENEFVTVTDRAVTESELFDLEFAWIIAKHVKSNAIVIAKNGQTIGIGAGQVSRIDSVKIAIMKAKEFGFTFEGAVAASDAFFPFADGLNEITSHGIKAIIQPGGSVRDNDVIEAANQAGAAMIFTGIRHFKH